MILAPTVLSARILAYNSQGYSHRASGSVHGTADRRFKVAAQLSVRAFRGYASRHIPAQPGKRPL
jgi:hypothetical protein